LAKRLRSLQARGRGLLLSQGVFYTQGWWKALRWAQLQLQVPESLQALLEDCRAVIQQLEQQLKRVERKLEASAPKVLPLGLGRLTFVLLLREVCNYQRFANRRGVGGFTGLCGAVSSSGGYHLDLSINKAGNPELRTLLVELAWRMTYWQPGYTGLRAWRRTGGVGAHKSRRKSAIVAVARQLAVDLWRWQTGRVTPEQLGWKMSASA
jgi:transposase